MKIEDLKPGMYEIAQDVVNPQADRRKSGRDFAAQPTWPKGKRVCVTQDWEFKARFTIFLPGGYQHLGVTGHKGGSHNHHGFDALVAALRPVEQTHREWVQIEVQCPDRVLVKLLDAGKITREDVLATR